MIVDERRCRPVEVTELIGDAIKAARALGWQPKTSLGTFVEIMVEHDLQAVEGND